MSALESFPSSMPDPNKYLIDTDVLIRAVTDTYRPEFAAGFWDWLVAGHEAGIFFSIDKVKKEIFDGQNKDFLHTWSQKSELSKFFLDTKAATSHWTPISAWATDPKRKYIEAAKAKFLNGEAADAWLIAQAMHDKALCIVTNEVAAPDSKNAIKIPDAAQAMGVLCVPLVQVLTKHAHGTFKFKK